MSPLQNTELNHITGDFSERATKAGPGTQEYLLQSGAESLENENVFDDSVSYHQHNGDGTVTFSHRCAQYDFTINESQIVLLDVIGVCGTSSLYHLIYNY